MVERPSARPARRYRRLRWLPLSRSLGLASRCRRHRRRADVGTHLSIAAVASVATRARTRSRRHHLRGPEPRSFPDLSVAGPTLPPPRKRGRERPRLAFLGLTEPLALFVAP